jgi:hypothetical protein
MSLENAPAQQGFTFVFVSRATLRREASSGAKGRIDAMLRYKAFRGWRITGDASVINWLTTCSACARDHAGQSLGRIGANSC